MPRPLDPRTLALDILKTIIAALGERIASEAPRKLPSKPKDQLHRLAALARDAEDMRTLLAACRVLVERRDIRL